ncbi:PTR2-Di-and tripeptide permease protein [Rutstroemia sp. NJR-2017a WRK4]|nr:PTR2-Di-and tripeptide permease protein [Rutstroemia sp. NJR-2017a WRK4]
MLFTSLPPALDHGAGVPGIVIAMIFIGIGVGGIKATVNAFIGEFGKNGRFKMVSSWPRSLTPPLGDQYEDTSFQVMMTGKGEMVVVDRTLTMQYIYNIFYWYLTTTELSLQTYETDLQQDDKSVIPTTFLERYVGFWMSYLLGPIALCIAIGLLFLYRNSFVKHPAAGNILPKAVKALSCAAKNKFKLEAADPAYQLEHFNKTVSWSSEFIAELRSGLMACQVLTVFGVFYLCFNQLSNNLVSQAGQMDLHGIPNDLIRTFNGIACVICGPIIQKGLYTLLGKYHISFGPIARITAAFIIMSVAMAYATVIQKLIYSSGPCYEYPLECAASKDGMIHNSVNVWIQVPLYFILAVAEILGFVSALEYSYSKAPKEMKAIIQAFTQLMSGLGAALGIAVSPAAKNPQLVWMYTTLASVMAATAMIFWLCFRKYDKLDAEIDKQNAERRTEE